MPRATFDRFVAEMCRLSYYDFFMEFCPTVFAEKLVNGWYIKKLCDELQVVAERVFLDKQKDYDLIWNCPPGTTKSTVVSVLFQPWLWTRMPSARVITGSYSERLALDLSRKSRDVVLSEKYQTLFPEVRLRDDQNAKGYFATSKGGIRYAVGVGGSVIGMHAHFILIDDPIDPQAALSELQLADANLWATETLSRRKVNVMLTPTILIMQRLHQDDLTGAMMARGTKVRHCVLPGDTTWDIKPPEFKEFYEDGLLDPQRLSKEALEEAEQTLGEAGYAGQYGQSPIPRGGAMFKVDNLIMAKTAPTKWKRGPIRYWDKAGTLGGGAFTVGAKVGVDLDDRVWILDIERGQWDTGTRERRIETIAKLDTKHVLIGIEQEPGSAGKESAENTAKRLSAQGFRVRMEKATGDKALRADPLSTQVNCSNVCLVEAPWNRAFIEEMRYFPLSKYKDQIDAAAGGHSFLTKARFRIGALR